MARRKKKGSGSGSFILLLLMLGILGSALRAIEEHPAIVMTILIAMICSVIIPIIYSEISKKNKNKRLKEEEIIRDEEIQAKRISNKIKEEETKSFIASMDKSRIICYDCETTGLNPEKDEILQLSIIDGNGKTLFNEYVKPYARKQWDEAARVNHITPEKVKDCKHIDEYLPQLQEIFDNAQIHVGYNLEFDQPFVANAGVMFNDTHYNFDVMLEFAKIYGEWNDYYMDYKWQKLTKCASYYKYKWQGTAHDSLADCLATLYCFNQMIIPDVDFIAEQELKEESEE